jgi:hypothetical protein
MGVKLDKQNINGYLCFRKKKKMKTLRKFWSYIAFWKPRPADEPSSFNLRMMHGINRISILMFIIALIVMIIRFAF